ncbi:MAG: hypothetical protein R2865_09195 [Deinococcales bacterium]
MLDAIMNPWDCAPFAVIVPEAGGYCGSWAGEKTIYASELISSNALLKDAFLKLIEG